MKQCATRLWIYNHGVGGFIPFRGRLRIESCFTTIAGGQIDQECPSGLTRNPVRTDYFVALIIVLVEELARSVSIYSDVRTKAENSSTPEILVFIRVYELLDGGLFEEPVGKDRIINLVAIIYSHRFSSFRFARSRGER